MSERDWSKNKVREFIGWLSGDIPELHSVEVPRLAESMERFEAKLVTDAMDEE